MPTTAMVGTGQTQAPGMQSRFPTRTEGNQILEASSGAFQNSHQQKAVGCVDKACRGPRSDLTIASNTPLC